MREMKVLLFLTLCAWVSLQQYPQNYFPTNPPAEACTSFQPAVGCLKCSQQANSASRFYCMMADNKYFINRTTGQAQNCPRNCGSCEVDLDDLVVCTRCAGYGFIFDYNCTECFDGYTLDNGNTLEQQLQNQDGVCIATDMLAPYKCVPGYVWNRAPGLERQCVPVGSSCLPGYSSSFDGKITQSIVQSCNWCEYGYSFVLTQTLNIDYFTIYNYDCLKMVYPVPRAPPVQCSNNDPTPSCLRCAGPNVCEEAAPGYYIETTMTNSTQPGNIFKCASTCLTCTSIFHCTSCNSTNSVLNENTGMCECANGYTPDQPQSSSIAYLESFFCVKRANNDQCASGYQWNSPIQIDSNLGPSFSSLSQCINPVYDYCYYDPQRTLLSVWNGPRNVQRQCVLASQRLCAYPYSNQYQGKYYSSYDITQGCNFCIQNFQLVFIYGNFNDQVCVYDG